MSFLLAAEEANANIGTYLFYIINCVIGAAGGICVKQHDKKTTDIRGGTHSFNMILALVSLVEFALTGLLSTGTFTLHGPTLWYAVMRGIAYVVGMIGYLEAVRHGPLLLSIIISRMGLAIPMIVSIFLYDEALTVLMVVGVVLLFLALFLFNKKEGSSESGGTSLLFWIAVTFSAVGNGIEGLATKMQQEATKLEFGEACYESELLFFSTLLEAVVFLVLTLVQPPRRVDASGELVPLPEGKKARVREFFALSSVGIGWVALYALSNATSAYIGARVISKLPVIFYFMASTGISILMTFVISRFLYREKLRPLQYLGVVVAAIGLVLINDWSSIL